MNRILNRIPSCSSHALSCSSASHPNSLRISPQLLYLEGLAALWWQVYKRRCATVDWGAFATVVTLEFGTEEFGAQMQSCCNCIKQVQSRSIAWHSKSVCIMCCLWMKV
jgi:hypothetical protein